MESVLWAFTHVHAYNWHPLTTLFHAANCTLYGVNPGGHHLCNVLVHAVTGVLLFLWLKDATGGFWPSAWVATSFAVHPLRVESVAWVSELKDVLSGLCFVLTLWAYVRYALRRRERAGDRLPVIGYGSYWVALTLYALGLMCKPMLVTVPFILMLVDYWPLKRLANDRMSRGTALSLLLEKVPFLALTGASCCATLSAQDKAINTLETLSPPLRIENALFSYIAYLRQSLVPARLSVFYPISDSRIPSWQTLLVLVLLATVTALTLNWRRSRPWLLVGWLWFLGMLVPVIGVVQVGHQAHADRYTYLPQIGLLIMVAFSAEGLSIRAPRLTGIAAVGSVATCACLAWAQTRHWRDSEALWCHALECTVDNTRAHLQLGTALLEAGKFAGAEMQYRRAIEIRPSAEAYNSSGTALEMAGKSREAERHYRLASLLDPRYWMIYANWGGLLARRGDLDGAMVYYRKALAIEPNDSEVRNNLGQALGVRDRLDEALEQFRQALAIKPDHYRALVGLREAMRRLGREEQSIPFLERACASSGDDRPMLLCLLAEAYAETGKATQALDAGHRAIRAAVAGGNPELITSIRSRVEKCFVVKGN